MAMRIGDYLVSIGVLTPSQVEEISEAQKQGDARRFGEIAIGKGWIEEGSLLRYTDLLSRGGDR